MVFTIHFCTKTELKFIVDITFEDCEIEMGSCHDITCILVELGSRVG